MNDPLNKLCGFTLSLNPTTSFNWLFSLSVSQIYRSKLFQLYLSADSKWNSVTDIEYFKQLCGHTLYLKKEYEILSFVKQFALQ